MFEGIKTEFPYTGEEDKIDKPPPAVPPNITPNGPSLDNATANLLQVGKFPKSIHITLNSQSTI